jgi:hypothetical protein
MSIKKLLVLVFYRPYQTPYSKGWSEQVVPRRPRGGICVQCDRYIYQSRQHDLGTAAARDAHVARMKDNPELQIEWNDNVTSVEIQGRTYSKRSSQPERAGMDDDIVRLRSRRLQGKAVVGYHCSTKDFKKQWAGPKPRKTKQFVWDGVDGVLIDPCECPVVEGMVPAWLTEITEVVDDGISRKSHVARDRFVGSTEAMDTIWDAAQTSTKVAKIRKGKSSTAENAPSAISLAYQAQEELTHFAGEGADEVSSSMELLWGQSILETAEGYLGTSCSCNETGAEESEEAPATKRQRLGSGRDSRTKDGLISPAPSLSPSGPAPSSLPSNATDKVIESAPSQSHPPTSEDEVETTSKVLDVALVALSVVENGDFNPSQVDIIDGLLAGIADRMTDKLTATYLEGYVPFGAVDSESNKGVQLLTKLGQVEAKLQSCKDVLVAANDSTQSQLIECTALNLILVASSSQGLSIDMEKCRRYRFELALSSMLTAGQHKEILSQVVMQHPV